MRRFMVALAILAIAVPIGAQAPTADQKQATVAWLQSLQKPDGSFGIDATGEIENIASALRALRYFGGEPKDPVACEKYVLRLRGPGGGMVAKPNDTTIRPSVAATALGIMALVELKKKPGFMAAQIDYLLDYAKTPEDIRMAAAALESAYGTAHKISKAAQWIAEVKKAQNPDGTFGNGNLQAFETASHIVTLLRLGVKIDNPEAIVKVLKDGQREDGGWSRDGGNSDLAATYRVMRAFHMLKAKPDVAACATFIAKCRNENGGYNLAIATADAKPSKGSISATYFAGAVSHWLEEMK